ncbi:MAG: hypothetical protein V3U98_05045 [Acidobacteriota bacterium]
MKDPREAAVRSKSTIYRIVGVCVTSIVLAWFALACAQTAGRCRVCEREIHPEMRAMLVTGEGHTVRTCCLRCALHYSEQLGTSPKEIRIADYMGAGLLEVSRAYIVEGSDENLCMLPPPLDGGIRNPLKLSYDRCASSLIGFRDAQQARAFIAEHGGVLRPPGTVAEAQAVAR